MIHLIITISCCIHHSMAGFSLSTSMSSCCRRINGSISIPLKRFLSSETNAVEKDAVLVDVVHATGMATVTLNRPQVHNAFNDKTILLLTEKFEELKKNTHIRAVFLRASGTSFCAGGDLNYMKSMASFSREQNYEDARRLSNMLHSLNTMPMPTIALVQGAAYGGGVGLVSACDIAVAVESSSFSLSEVKLGLIPATISPFVLSKIGAHNARRFFLTGERFDSKTALQSGLLHKVVQEFDELDLFIEKLKADFLSCSPDAVRASKQLINTIEGRHISPDLLNETAELLCDIRSSDFAQEGMTAFLEKRRPTWTKIRE